MAKKNKNIQAFTEPQGFTHGMISDIDPHFQLTGSYSDAQNIRLTNSEGNTFTVENIEGNSLLVDLATYDISVNEGQGGSTSWTTAHTFRDRGPSTTLGSNYHLGNRCSIVGSYSYASQLLLIIVGRFNYDRGSSYATGSWVYTPFADQKDRTIFLMVDFNEDLEVTKVSDLRLCYNAGYGFAAGNKPGAQQYPDLGMDLDTPIRVEGLVENECISRIYWTDNKNSLRTVNINQERLDLLSIESLDITPLMSPSQPVLDSTISGSLPVGVYQYAYKYISENGGETTFSPLSNLYHASDKSFGSSVTYAGGPQGNIGTQGFNIKIYDIDQNFDYIELYSLFYEDLNNPPRVSLVSKNVITNSSEMGFTHVGWNNELDNGLEEILIATNTWDVCKDIAIKDNILFAANLKQKKNWISEKEWNVKVMRFVIRGSSHSNVLDAMLTTNDTNIKHYDGNGVIAEETADANNNVCGHGQLLGADGSQFDVSTSANAHLEYDGNLNNPMWTTAYNQRHGVDGSDTRVKTEHEFRYLSDRKTLGAESFNYSTNTLGGCRVTFGLSQREADQTQNPSTSPFISANTADPEAGAFEDRPMTTDNIYDWQGQGYGSEYDNTNTVFKSSMSLGGTKDPHAAGDRRGYQRGEVYRFGVQVYDLNGSPGNVLWIGDIQTPEQYDPLRMLRTWQNNNNSADYSPRFSTAGLNTAKLFVSHQKSQDHRLSYVYGHTVPPCDVQWFTDRKNQGNANTNDTAYVTRKGEPIEITSRPNTTQTGFKGEDARIKGLTIGPFKNNSAQLKDPFDMYATMTDVNHTHYLFDLFVHFEFIIPDTVCKKISGFRVVRAERKEEDRRVVQQGLLNQTVQYGDASKDLSYGYDETNFSAVDNAAFDDDPVFVNPEPASGADPSPVEQPEYNTYLNGYLGLAENSYMAWCDQGFDRSTSDPGGKVTPGGNTEGLIYYHPEHEDAKHYHNHRKSYAMPNHRNDHNPYGPGRYATHKRNCGYFGGLDTLSFKKTSKRTDETYPYSDFDYGRAAVSGSVFTLDSPDSAFGIRPYNFRSGDMLRIDSIMKLTDSERYKTLSSSWRVMGYFGHNLNTGNIGEDSSITTSGTTQNVTFFYSEHWDVLINVAYAKDKSIQESLRFAARQDINDNYGILIGKYYSWDTGYAINQELNGGETLAKDRGGSDIGDRPKTRGQWLPINNSKEISDGEIVPAGFFTNSRKITKGRAHGFSNNTLGFVRSRATFTEACYVFGAVNKNISRYNGEAAGDIYGSAHDAAWDEDKQAKDFNYDTVSTMQMGLRSILIEVSNEIKNVRKYGPNDDDTYFKDVGWGHGTTAEGLEYLHDAWFAPQNFSVIQDQGSWIGYETSSTVSYNKRGTSDAALVGYHEDYHKSGSRTDTTGLDTASGYNKTGQISDNGRAYHPHKYLCSIIRKITPYGGHNKAAIDGTRYIPCGNFHPVKYDNAVGIDQAHTSKVFGGDTFVNLYSHQKTSTPYMKRSMARWQVFPVESYVNTDMRSGLTLNNGDTEIGKEIGKAPYSNDWLYNSVYSQENTIKSGLIIDEKETCENLDLPYEIAYSNTKVSGQPGDSFRNFPINQFHDMEGLYGEINRIVNFKNEIYVFQDSAFAKLLVNPLSMLSDDTGTSLFTGTGETVENHIYISTKYGTRQRFSVAMSEKSLYFVDTNYARLFKYDTEQLTSLGDALGQRNYLKSIISEWEKETRKVCTRTTPHSSATLHPTYKGRLNSMAKPSGTRNYFADNPLKFLGVTSIFDFKNKELMVTFHNSGWADIDRKRLTFADRNDNHGMGSSTNGQAVKISETLVYNESVNAFTSKYSVAPPQWLAGGQGSFIVCPENEIDVHSIGNFNSVTGQSSGNYSQKPYNLYGSEDGGLSGHTSSWVKNYRPNPLRLWLWDRHDKGKKTNFFGKKDDTFEFNNIGQGPEITSPIDSGDYRSSVVIENSGLKYVADESYIEKIISEDAGTKKTFDNVRIIMTPGDIPSESQIGYSFVDFSTETSGDQYGVIKNRWEFKDGLDGWSFFDGADAMSTTGYISPLPNSFLYPVVLGCTDSSATNYNSEADTDDSSCYYGVTILGCTNSTADNYNSNANVNDGSCTFSTIINGCTDPLASNYYSTANTDNGNCQYPVYGCTDSLAINYNSAADTDNGLCTYTPLVYGCTDTTANNYNPLATSDNGICAFDLNGCTDPFADNYDSAATVDDSSCTYPVLGCTDPNASNYDSTATLDDGSCIATVFGCTDTTASNYNSLANTNDSSCEYLFGCMDSTAFNYDSTAIGDNGSCIAIVYGCMDFYTANYNATANVDDGSCVPCVYGCTDSTACSNVYDPLATCDDGSCTYPGCIDPTACNYDSTAGCTDGSCSGNYGCMDPTALNYDSSANCSSPLAPCIATVNGCMDSTQFNYNSSANVDVGCISFIYGCTDSQATNYNSSANTDDNTCTYPTGCTDPGSSNYNSNVIVDDGSCIACIYGCTDSSFIEYDSSATCNNGTCATASVYGCTNSNVSNYDSTANVDDGSCCVDGCTDSTQFGYDSAATCDDGSCSAIVYGCQDSTAPNYNSLANTDDPINFACISCTYGCTDSTACNYDSTALCNDPNNSCLYGTSGCTDPAATNYDSTAVCDDLCTYPVATGVAARGDCTAQSYYPSSTGCSGTYIMATCSGNYSTTDRGSHYDAEGIRNSGSLLSGTWTGPNGTTYTVDWKVTHFWDFDNGVEVHFGHIPSYIQGISQYTGNPHPTVNWGINKAILQDYADPNSTSHTHGPCTYNNGTEITKGVSTVGSNVVFDPPTNPYSLP